jgi:uncharacterized protein (DUF952 family)
MIFKILRRSEWDEARLSGAFFGSPDDKRDGFIHFSAAHQLRATAEKHFAGEAGLILLGVDPDALGDALKWEVSRGGDKFPHLYAELPLNAVASITEIRRDALGRPIFPPQIP